MLRRHFLEWALIALRRHFLEWALIALTGPVWEFPVVDGTSPAITSRKSVVQFSEPKFLKSAFGKPVTVVYIKIPAGQETVFWNEIMDHVMGGKPAPDRLRKIYASYAEYSKNGKTACDGEFFMKYMGPAVEKSDKFIFELQDEVGEKRQSEPVPPQPSNDELLRDHLKDDPQDRLEFFGAS